MRWAFEANRRRQSLDKAAGQPGLAMTGIDPVDLLAAHHLSLKGPTRDTSRKRAFFANILDVCAALCNRFQQSMWNDVFTGPDLLLKV